MIVVRVELHSAVDGRVTEIGRMAIANIGGDKDRGDYDVTAQWTATPGGAPAGSVGGLIKRHPRDTVVWTLVAEALRLLFLRDGRRP